MTRVVYTLRGIDDSSSANTQRPRNMELYATGLNAWGQLSFDGNGTDQDPDDTSLFTCVLRDDDISGVTPFQSFTLVHTSSGTRKTGFIPREEAALSALGSTAFPHLARAANGILVVDDTHPALQAVSNLRSTKLTQLFRTPPPIRQLVAYDTGFAALSPSGNVWTWGDERYGGCLGRDLSQSRAETPSIVTDLLYLPTGPITKIAAGGYVLAALTAGHDLYVWGHAGRATVAGLGGLELGDVPEPVVIEDHDIADIAVGEAHVIALTTTGEVFVIGSNSNGQLGLGAEVSSADSWTKVSVDAVDSHNKEVVAVTAGPRNSFLVVRNKPDC
ncbi:E3 ubiquitin-protein ligase HERC2 [Echria macrotheca]|uniref:E3 ubiquitin-protein ligase HERC2 n=1 Tax=Echria macrotheca TaxID=438768 RepID=A0AAJ0BAA6_9PEZI|nr:E3 ubiquitin-protein ligase HERC2 [Echria macrotheca]